MSDRYILGGPDGHDPIECHSIHEWAAWFEQHDKRRVADERVGDVRISTVFLGLDHCFGGYGSPILFETMIFGGPHDQEQWRCSFWDEAEVQHRKAVELVKSATAILNEEPTK